MEVAFPEDESCSRVGLLRLINPQVPCVWEDVKCWGAQDSMPEGTKPRTRIIKCLEEKGIERKQISLLSKDVKSHHQSDQGWKVFVGKYVGFLSKGVKSHLQSDQRLKVFVLRTTVEKLVRDRVELGSHRHHLGLNWAELIPNTSGISTEICWDSVLLIWGLSDLWECDVWNFVLSGGLIMSPALETNKLCVSFLRVIFACSQVRTSGWFILL